MSCVAGMCLALPASASGPARGEELVLVHVQDDLVMCESKKIECSNYQTVVIGLRECSLPVVDSSGALPAALGPGREGA
jgi:hypothetical protein